MYHIYFKKLKILFLKTQWLNLFHVFQKVNYENYWVQKEKVE